jgi:SAM-dependent methyltransferase
VDLDELRRNWDEFGRSDPLWAILSEPGTQGGRWDLERFLAAGDAEIEGVLAHLTELGVAPKAGRALDFGCGVGRLTQALARTFASCDGVDIAEPMIEEARRINQRGDRCTYHVNTAPNLGIFEDERFDFVYSNLVLQHMEPRYSLGYLAEFGRVLAPGGVTMFQLPYEPLPPDELDIPPLPDDGYQARIEPAEAQLDVHVGATVKLGVRVTNTSAAVWPEGYALRVGNHWLSGHRRMLTFDDGREAVPRELAPGESAELTVIARAPNHPGSYIMELDLVQERIAWFATRGSPTVDVAVRVRRLPRLGRWRSARRRAATPLRPVMEIHGAPPDVVTGVLDGAGLRLVELGDSDCVPGWRDHTYVAQKPARA